MEEGLDVGEEVGRREGLVEGRRSGGVALGWRRGRRRGLLDGHKLGVAQADRVKEAAQGHVEVLMEREAQTRRTLAKTANTLAAAIGERDGLKEALN